MENRYLVSIFVNDKCVDSFFADTLDSLMTVKAVHGKCDISVYDIEKYERIPDKVVASAIRESYSCWEESLNKTYEEPENPVRRKKGKAKRENVWELAIRCPETGKEYKSVRECSDDTGIPYMTITNCVRRGNPTRGLHFERIPKVGKE